MSRVFEALTKAGEESKEVDRKSGVGWAVADKSLTSGLGNFRRRADTQSLTITLQQLHSWPESWRRRLEELLLGWNLRRYKTHPLVALETESPATEHYKILRERVKRMRTGTGARSLLVTSPVKRDGKTIVAANLATVTALNFKEEVLLIDGDLRFPQIHRYFGIEPSPGLADYLSSGSKEDLPKYIQNTFLPTLQILPAGKPQDFPSELLAKLKTRNLMEEIRSRFPDHQIITDTSPVLSTPDPLVLARAVEGIIMVIRAGKTPRNCLLEAVKSLNSSKPMGIVLSGTERY